MILSEVDVSDSIYMDNILQFIYITISNLFLIINMAC